MVTFVDRQPSYVDIYRETYPIGYFYQSGNDKWFVILDGWLCLEDMEQIVRKQRALNVGW